MSNEFFHNGLLIGNLKFVAIREIRVSAFLRSLRYLLFNSFCSIPLPRRPVNKQGDTLAREILSDGINT